jgi:hypothetical protein
MMDPLFMLGGFAVIIGMRRLIVLLKGRKKNPSMSMVFMLFS